MCASQAGGSGLASSPQIVKRIIHMAMATEWTPKRMKRREASQAMPP